jgi:uncharacterized glyoxalase superfamily protein PhnB
MARPEIAFVQDTARAGAYGRSMTDTQRPNIFPAITYRDADAALAFLTSAFGFEEKAVYRDDDGVIQHGELRLGAGLVMFGQHRPSGFTGDLDIDAKTSPTSIYVVVGDPDAHHAQAKQAGATIIRELSDMDYGSREFSAADPEGNRWSFGTYDPYAES